MGGRVGGGEGRGWLDSPFHIFSERPNGEIDTSSNHFYKTFIGSCCSGQIKLVRNNTAHTPYQALPYPKLTKIFYEGSLKVEY